MGKSGKNCIDVSDYQDSCSFEANCLKCGTKLNFNKIWNEFKCSKCGVIYNRGIFDPDYDHEEIDCPQCGSYMRYMEASNEYVCSKCGFYIDCDDMEDSDIPEGCAACGGPYPQCTSSCKLFDD